MTGTERLFLILFGVMMVGFIATEVYIVKQPSIQCLANPLKYAENNFNDATIICQCTRNNPMFNFLNKNNVSLNP